MRNTRNVGVGEAGQQVPKLRKAGSLCLDTQCCPAQCACTPLPLSTIHSRSRRPAPTCKPPSLPPHTLPRPHHHSRMGSQRAPGGAPLPGCSSGWRNPPPKKGWPGPTCMPPPPGKPPGGMPPPPPPQPGGSSPGYIGIKSSWPVEGEWGRGEAGAGRKRDVMQGCEGAGAPLVGSGGGQVTRG